MFPTDARLLNRAREILVRLASGAGIRLRQSYARGGKFALIKHQRYAHAKQFKRANEALRTLRTYLGRVIRDIARKVEGNAAVLSALSESALGRMLALARRVLDQKQHQRGPKVYSLHAPEVECIGKGKAHRPYEFGVKVSVATTLAHAKGGQFVTHVKALPGTLMTATRSQPSSRTWRSSSATPSSASSPTKAIAATMPRPITSSGCSPRGRSGG